LPAGETTDPTLAPSYDAAMSEPPDPNCIFCKIVAGSIPVERLYEDDLVLAFPDREPKAPTHILVIPKRHLESHADATDEDQHVFGHILMVAAGVAREKGLDEGYRLVINCGREGGQTVPHLHLHILGGRKLGWPPG
jgi:histidine triad (HIT) family protein